MQNILIRNVKQEDLWSVSSIVVEGWKSAYRGIIDDEFLDSLKIEDNYNRRLKDYKENEKSHKMQLKFGYKDERIRRQRFVSRGSGKIEDEYITGLLKDEWIKES